MGSIPFVRSLRFLQFLQSPGRAPYWQHGALERRNLAGNGMLGLLR